MLFLRGQVETAMDHLIQIVKRDRDWRGGQGAQAAGQVLRGAGAQGPGDAQGPPDAVHGAVQLSDGVSELASSLPDRFPVFPLRGAMLLPGGNLPLNIFEPRYLQMVRDAMQTDRVIGMIQPKAERDRRCATRPLPDRLRRPDHQFLRDRRRPVPDHAHRRLPLRRRRASSTVATPYRQVTADFARWRHDLQPKAPPGELKAGLARRAPGVFRPPRHRGRLGARSRPRRWRGW